MAQPKYRKKPRHDVSRGKHFQAQPQSTPVSEGGEDSDSDLNHVVPAVTVSAGSNAYQALVGALDKHTAKRKQIRKASARLGEPADWRQQQVQQPLEPDSVAAQSDDVVQTKQASLYGRLQILAQPAEADQPEPPAADHFYQHFQRAGQDQGSALLNSSPSDAVSSTPEEHKSPWAAADWLNTGQPLPKVSLADVCVV